MNKYLLGRALLSLLLAILFALNASAQTNFVWTNNTSGAWGTTSKWNPATGPNAGGSNDYIITFNTNATLVTTNNLGLPNFTLNQLIINTGGVTIFGGTGTNLVFTNNTSGVLPQVTQSSASNVTLNIRLTLTTNTTFTGNGGGLLTVSQLISGSGSLLKTGTSTVLLSVSNGYTGGTTINQGILRLGNTNSLGAPTTGPLVTVNAGGALDLNGVLLSVASITKTVVVNGAGVSANNGAIMNAGAALVNQGINFLELGSNAAIGGDNRFDIRTSLNGGGFTLTKVGTNEVGLAGTTYNLAGLVVSNGMLTLLNANALDAAAVSVASAGNLRMFGAFSFTNAITVNGGTIAQGSGNGVWSGAITLAGTTNNIASDGAGGTVTFSGSLDGGGALRKSGTNTVILAGTNSYAAGTIINAGLLQFNDTNALPATGLISINTGGALINTGAYSAVTNWLASGRLNTASAGALALVADNSETIDLTTNGTYTNLSLGAQLGKTVAFTGILAPAANGYFAGGGGGTIIFSNANAFTGAGVNTTFGNGGGGTVIVTSSNDASGITTITAGTLQLGTGGNAGWLNSTAIVNNGTVIYNRSDAMTNTAPITGSGALTVANGTLALAGTNNLTGTVIVGSLTTSRSTLLLQTNASLGKLFVGNASGVTAAGAVIQNGGSISVGPTIVNNDALSLGLNGGYGYYQMNAGTLITGQLALGGNAGSGDTGVFDMNGGIVNLSGASGWLLAAGWQANAKGQFNLYGGTMVGPAGGNAVTLSVFGNGGYGMINLLGSNAVLIATNSGGVSIRGQTSAHTGSSNNVFNLNSGTLVASRIQQPAAGNSQFNFNGGTLQAVPNTTNANFFSLNTGGAAYIYGNGGTIDTTNSTITIAQSLRAPTGSGVTSITLSNNGTGYIGTPFIYITGGSGVGATAVAQVDFSTGQITNILVTSAGVGYQETDVLAVNLVGGGATTAATISNITFASNTSGALTKQGVGTLILTGTNDYSGGTIINAGVLQFNSTAARPGVGLIVVNTNGAVAFNYTGAQYQYDLTWTVDKGSTGAIALLATNTNENVDFAAAGLSNAFLGAVGNITYTGAFTPFTNTYRLGRSSGVLTYTTAIGAGSNVILGGNVILTGTNSYDGTILVTGGNTLRADDGIGLSQNANLILSNGVLETGANFTRSLGTGTNQVQIFGGGFSAIGAPVTVNINNDGSTLVWSNGSAFNPAPLILNAIPADNTLNLANGLDFNGADRTIAVYATNPAALATISGVITGTGGLLKTGVGTLILATTNNYTGGTTINNGTLRLGTADALPVATAVTITNLSTAALDLNGNNQQIGSLAGGGRVLLGGGALTVGDASSTIFGGVISGAGNLTKIGTGTLILTNAQTYTGSTIITNGMIQLGQGLVRPGLQEAYTNVTSYWQPNPLLANSVITTNTRWANVNAGGGSYPPVWGSGTWPQNTTIGYNGYLYNSTGTNATWTFAVNCDDAIRLYIDGVQVLSTSGNNAVRTNLVMTTGQHQFELRLANGTSNGGANYNVYGTGSCFVYDPLGRDTNVASAYIIPTDIGNGVFYTSSGSVLPVSTTVALASGATLDLNGNAQMIAGLTDYGAGGGLVTNTAGLTAFLNIALPLGTNATFSGVIGDTGGNSAIALSINGSGTQRFTTAQNFSGGLVVNGGGLYLAPGDNPITTNNAITVNGGVLDIGGGTQTTTNIISFRGGVTQNGTLNSLTANYDGRAGTVSANLDGPVGLNKTTSGLLVLSGSNTFAGNVALNGGTLSVEFIADSVASGIGFGSTLSISNSALQLTGAGNYFTARAITNPGTATFDITNPAANLVLTGDIGGAGAINKVGLGTLQWSNNLVQMSGGGLIVKQGTLLMNGSVFTNIGAVQDWVGGASGDNARLVLSNNSQFVKTQNQWFQIGYNTGATGVVLMVDGLLKNGAGGTTAGISLGNLGVGALYQLGGVINNNAGEFDVGYAVGGYGFYQMLDGALTNNSWIQSSRAGIGLLYQNNGTITTTANGIIIGGGGGNATGVVYLTGGLISGSQPIYTSYNAPSRAELTLAGGVININNVIQLNRNSNAVDSSIINLNGGVLQLNAIYKQNAVGLAIFNFNGGTLRANQTGTIMGTGAGGAGPVDAAYVWEGGAVIDSSSFTMTIAQNLLAPTGSGVVINASLHLDGYVGAPYVAISGTGTGATAVALFDYTDGSVTGIVVTSPGVGYTGTPIVTLIGGGNTNYTLASGVDLAANASGGLTKNGTGTLILSGTNTYGGPTILNAGILQFNSALSISPGTTNVVVPFGATLAAGYAMNTNFINLVSAISSGTVALAANSANPLNFNTPGLTNVSLGAVGGTYTNSGVLTPFGTTYRLGGGGGTLVVSTVLTDQTAGATSLIAFSSGSGGAVILNTNNTYTGSTFVNGSLLEAVSAAALPGYANAGSVTVASGAILSARVGGAGWTSAQLDSLLNFGSFSNNAILGLNTVNTNFTYASNITNEIGVAKFGANTLFLTGNNTYTGGTFINAGTLNINADAALGALPASPTTNITFVGNSALQLPADYVLPTNRIVLINTGVNATFDTQAYTNTITSMITGPGILTKTGSGLLILSNANTYTGGTFINTGTITPGINNALPTNGAVTMGYGANVGNLNLDASSQTIAGLTIAANGTSSNRITIGVGQTLTIAGNVLIGTNVNGSTTLLAVSGAGTLIINNDGGTVKLGAVIGTNLRGKTAFDMSNLGSFIMDLGSGALTIGASSDNDGAYPNTVILSASNFLRAATILVGGSNAGSPNYLKLGSGTNILYVNALNLGTAVNARDYGVVQFNTSTGSVILRATNGIDRANVTVGGNSSGTGYIATNIFDVTGHDADLLIETLTIGNYPSRGGAWSSTFSFDQGVLDASNVVMAAGCKLGTSGAAIMNIGGGTANLGPISLSTSWAAGILNITGGIATVNGDITRGAAATNNTILTLNGGQLDMQDHSIGSGANPIQTLNLQSGTLIGVAQINGGGAVAKTTSGLLNYLGTNAYTGATLIQAGTLAINGYLPSSAVTVTSGGTLAGIGTIGQTVTVDSGTLSPGNSIGTLTVGNLTLTNNPHLVFELGPTNASDLVVVNNTLSLGGMDTNWFVLSAGAGFGEGTYTLFDATNIIGMLGSVTNFDNIGGYTGYLWLDEANQDVKLTVVPEPGTGTLVGAGLVAMFLLRRRRRA